MKKPETFGLQEPEIKIEDILVVKDRYFHPRHVAVVTGAASGIGRATAIALGINGLTVIGTDINEEGGQETVKIADKLGGRVIFIKTDLCNDEQIEESVREASQHGNIKFLANIAGMQHIGNDDSDRDGQSLYNRLLLLGKIPHRRRPSI